MDLTKFTFAHSGPVVDDKGGNIFIISHLGFVCFCFLKVAVAIPLRMLYVSREMILASDELGRLSVFSSLVLERFSRRFLVVFTWFWPKNVNYESSYNPRAITAKVYLA